VLSVCRQVLGGGHASEDAFQATFLVLVRRAGSLRLRHNRSLGAWLHGVAYRTALKARQGASRRRAREQRVARPEALASQVVDAAEQDDLGAALHAEVTRLPAKYRAPVVLCYFEGRTHDEAAASLSWPVGTVRCRLFRARELLRSRLTRRGLAPAIAPLAATWPGPPARADVPAPLLRAALETAMGGAPEAAARLAEVVLKSLLAARSRMAAAALALIATAAGFAFVLRGAPRSPSQPRPPDLSSALSVVAPARPKPPPVDQFGDPLPEHARARMGTIRFNAGAGPAQVFFAPDGKSLYTPAGRRGVQVWDVASGRVVRRVGDGDDSQGELALSPDGRMLAVHRNGVDGLRLYDPVTGRELRRWHLPEGGRSFWPRFSPDGKILATVFAPRDRRVQNGELIESIDLWDTTGLTERPRRLEGIPYNLRDLRFSPDNKLLGLAVFDRYMAGRSKLAEASTRVWDIAAGKERTRFPVGKPDFGPLSLAFSPDGRRLFVGVTDQTIRVYDLAAGREVTPPLNHEHALEAIPRWGTARKIDVLDRTMDCLTFSPDGSILAAAARWTDNTGGPSAGFVPEICLWDVARGKVLRHFPANEELILSLSFAPDGTAIASNGMDAVVRLWDVATGREASLQSGHRSAVTLVVVSPADGTAFTGSRDGTIRRWDPATGRELGVIADLPYEIDAMDIAPDGRTLVVGEGGYLLLWSVAERREVRRFSRAALPADGYGFHAVFSPDGTKIASDLGVFDVASGKVLATFRDQKFALKHMASYVPTFFSSDSRQVITAEAQGARVWDIATSKEVRWAVRSRFPVDGVGIAGTIDHSLMSAVLSADGRFLATSGSIYFNGWAQERFDPAIRIWELATGREVAVLKGHQGRNRGLAFSRDGRLLASCSVDFGPVKDSTIRVWDIATGRELRRLEGHLGRVNALVFTPDSRSLITASDDATALVWDVSDL
jgi:RNA polymerase sigma factor (sigma-70 family)